MHTELFMKRMVKIIAIRMYANWFKRFKNGDFDISDKELTFRTPCSCGRERIAEKMGKREKIVGRNGKYFD